MLQNRPLLKQMQICWQKRHCCRRRIGSKQAELGCQLEAAPMAPCCQLRREANRPHFAGSNNLKLLRRARGRLGTVHSMDRAALLPGQVCTWIQVVQGPCLHRLGECHPQRDLLWVHGRLLQCLGRGSNPV